MTSEEMLWEGLIAGGAPALWVRAFRDGLPLMHKRLPEGSRVLEIGHGDGLLTCFLARHLGWVIEAWDLSPEAHGQAQGALERFGLADEVTLKIGSPFETAPPGGRFNGVFVKTVLYNARDTDEYLSWLRWIAGTLEDDGVMVNFETARSGALTRLYRRLRRRSYANSLLYSPDIELLYDKVFDPIMRRYYGGWSQFLAPISPLFRLGTFIEEGLHDRNADNCFLASLILEARARP